MRNSRRAYLGSSVRGLFLLGILLLLQSTALAQSPVSSESFTFRIYETNYALYPFVQVYIRTFDQNKEPLVNVNYANIGVMVKGRMYDPENVSVQARQAQYSIETLQNRNESFRSVIVWDCSKSMQGQPFSDARSAILKYIEAKRPGDQIAIVALRDAAEGYQVVSSFEKNPVLLMQRVGDVQCDGLKTQLFDGVWAAIGMCSMASQGGITDDLADYVILNSILVVSDGEDDGSAISRAELVSRIGALETPIPVYSLAYSSKPSVGVENLKALSDLTFGRYWGVTESREFSTVVQHIHQINRSDYVITFRSYVPVDGEKHAYKIGLRYPANTGQFLFQGGEFEAIDVTPALSDPQIGSIWERYNQGYPPLADPPGPFAPSASTLGAGTPVGDATSPEMMAATTPSVPESGGGEAGEVGTVAGSESAGASSGTGKSSELPASIILIGAGGVIIVLIGLLFLALNRQGKYAGANQAVASAETQRARQASPPDSAPLGESGKRTTTLQPPTDQG